MRTLWITAALLALLTLPLTACGEDEDNGSQAAQQQNNANNAANNGEANNAANNGEANNAVNNGEGNNGEEEDPLAGLPAQPWSVYEAGHFNVGYRTGTLRYTPQGADGERSLRVAYWYPSRETREQGISYIGIPRPEVYAEVEPAHSQPAPVLVFSHGSGGLAEQSYTMMEFFASHGWVVVAPDHTGNTFLDVGRGIPPETLEYRPQDISAVIDHLQALPEEDALAPMISEDIVLSGHSFGGYTTLAVSGASYSQLEDFLVFCEQSLGNEEFCDYLAREDVQARFRAGFRDDRVKVAIPMAPFGGPVFGPGVAQIEVPTLLMTALRDRTLPPEQDGDPIWNGLDDEEDVRVDFTTGGHFTFSDACALEEALNVSIAQGDGCGADFIPPDQAYFVINAFAMAYARLHLWGDATDQALLEGEQTLDTSVEVSTR
jgi:predicted dienelactone hydrolase